MPVRYFKRYRMEFNAKKQSLPEPVLPAGFEFVEWDNSFIDTHATVKADSFSGEIDATVFPCLSHFAGCQKLMRQIASGRNFLPAATWLIKHPSDIPILQYCGTIQGMLRSNQLGAIQNIGISPSCRGLGLGRAILTQSLHGFISSGASRVYLDVTAANNQAVSLYHSLGFQILDTSYLSVVVPEPSEVSSL